MKNRGLSALPKRKVAGFTLIELLVVIAVIGILASVVMASLNSARVKARNARRSSDLTQLRNAFSLGIDGSGTLPSTGGNWVCVSAICSGYWAAHVSDTTVDAYLAPYLPTKPSDPTGGNRGYGGYLYNSSWAGFSYPNGVVLPAGSYLYWTTEPPLVDKSCAPGRLLTTDSGGNVGTCMVQLNP